MGIVTPPRGSKGRPPILNGKSGGGSPADPGSPRLPAQGSKGAPPNLNGGGGNSLPGYGTVGGGPYDPVRQPQSTRSSSAPLH
jgi:hypothetical protein